MYTGCPCGRGQGCLREVFELVEEEESDEINCFRALFALGGRAADVQDIHQCPYSPESHQLSFQYFKKVLKNF